MFLLLLFHLFLLASILPSAVSALSAIEQELALNCHNALRSQLTKGMVINGGGGGPMPPGSNLVQLKYDPAIEAIAQSWAKQCTMAHSSRTQRGNMGENLYMTTSSTVTKPVALQQATQFWWGELRQFGIQASLQLTAAEFNKGIGHWSQMAWASTTRVGCAVANCPNSQWKTYVVCNYSPAGNFLNQNVYQRGVACNACGPGATSSASNPNSSCYFQSTTANSKSKQTPMWMPPPTQHKMLIAIAILPLLFLAKQTSAQEEPATEPPNGMPPAAATGMTYGLGGYTLDDKEHQVVELPEYTMLLKTADDVKNYMTNNHADKQFKPCRVELNKDNKFEVFYDMDAAKDGCTVDFVVGNIDENKTITTEIKVKDTNMSCLEDCGDNKWAATSKNIVPFSYSLSNEEFKKLHSGPPYLEDQTSCLPEWTCPNYGGKCMNSTTSLQLAWVKCRTGIWNMAQAYIQLVGEPESLWAVGTGPKDEDSKGEYPDEAILQLSIEMGDNPKFTENKVPVFSLTGEGGIGYTSSFLNQEYSDGGIAYPVCFLDEALPMIPEPKFWTIKSDNAELNDKHLLVFHLLPQAATRVFKELRKLLNDQAPEMPKCIGKLSIIFQNVAGLLQDPTGLPPSTSTATESTTKATEESEGTRSSEGTGPTDRTTQNATRASTTASPAGGGNIVLILAIVGAVVLLLLIVVVAFLLWCLCCRDKKEGENEEDAEAGADVDTEKESAKEEGAEDVPVPEE